jgi:photosystem I P700 chlorophyll a apoprotein A1
MVHSTLWASLFPGFHLLNLFSLNWRYLSGLTCFGSVNPNTCGLWITDVAHHHLAIGVMFLVAGHLYQTSFNLGSSFTVLLRQHQLLLINSWHGQLAINLAVLGSVSILFSHHIYAMPAYGFLAFDHATILSLFTHHMWIGGFFIVGAGAHGGLFMVYDIQTTYKSIVERLMSQKHSVVVHLNWVSIFLGFHSFGLYIHNDSLNALGRTGDMISDSAITFQPVFAQWLQHFHVNTFNQVLGAPGWTHTVYGIDQVGLLPIPLGTADTLIHHIHAFTIHVTALILLKGVLFARGSRLIADKALLGFRFP